MNFEPKKILAPQKGSSKQQEPQKSTSFTAIQIRKFVRKNSKLVKKTCFLMKNPVSVQPLLS
jgi:hypothetical protein